MNPDCESEATAGSSRLASLATYAVALGLCLVFLAFTLKLRGADLTVPLLGSDDGLIYRAWVQTVIEEGWYFSTPRLGAPAGSDIRDFPMADHLHFLVVRLIGVAFPDSAVCSNLYYLLSFLLTTLSALFVLRRLGVSAGPAVVGSLLFTFLPYHFLRLHHLFLASYYLVPLSVLVMLRVCLGPIQTTPERGEGGRVRTTGTFAAVLVCLLLAAGGIYYAFFTCFLLLIAGLYAAWFRRQWAPVRAALLFVGVIVLGVGASLSPTFLYQREHGKNPSAVSRSPGESEQYALKPVQLVLPIPGHRVGKLSRLQEKYSKSSPIINENLSAALGVVGGSGFVFLIVYSFRPRREDSPALLDSLSVLTLAGLLLTTAGGGGSLFSLLGGAKIRAYNRISVYLGFFALVAVAVGLDRLTRGRLRLRPAVCYGLLAAVLCLGVLDQSSPVYTPDHGRLRKEHADDACYFAAIEASLPPSSMVFQLPYVLYPENPSPHRMGFYHHLRGYLHTRTLRWSYGAMKGRDGDLLLRQIAASPVEEMVERLTARGFAGIFINRDGYADDAADLENSLRSLLGREPLASADGRLLFFSMRDYPPQKPAGYTASQSP